MKTKLPKFGPATKNWKLKKNKDVVVQILERGKWILETYCWTQDENAKTADGEVVYTHTPNAVRFCANGAICCAQETTDANAIDYQNAYDALSEEASAPNIIQYNDAKGRQKRHIIALFNRAIKKRKKEVSES